MMKSGLLYVSDPRLLLEAEEKDSILRKELGILCSTNRVEKHIEAWSNIDRYLSTASYRVLKIILKSNESIFPSIVSNSSRSTYNKGCTSWLSATHCMISTMKNKKIAVAMTNSELFALSSDFVDIYGLIQDSVQAERITKQFNSAQFHHFEEQAACLLSAAVILNQCDDLSEDDPIRASWVEALEGFATGSSKLWSNLNKHLLLMYTLHLDSSRQINDRNNDSAGSFGSEATIIPSYSSPRSSQAARPTSAAGAGAAIELGGCGSHEEMPQRSLAVLPSTPAQKLLHALYTSNCLRCLLFTSASQADTFNLNLTHHFRHIDKSSSVKLSADSSGKYTSARTSVDTTSFSSSADVATVTSGRARFIELASSACMMENTMFSASLDLAENAPFLRPTPEEVMSTIISALYYTQDLLAYVRSLESDTTAILSACRRGDTAAVCALLSVYPLMVHGKNEEDQTLIHRYVMEDFYSSSAASSLLVSQSRCSSPRKLDRNRSQSTVPAVEVEGVKEEYSVLPVLLTYPFNVDAIDKAGRTALHYCAKAPPIASLCEHGADVNVVDERGFTPLMQYVLSGYADCVRTILQYRADAAISEPLKNRNCLHFAATLGQYSMLEAIVASGSVDVNKTDAHGNTALHLAAACEFQGSEPMTMILYLLNNGASVAARNNAGITMLHLVCTNQLLSPILEPLVAVLLDKGADPNAADGDGCTPLIVACAHRQFTVCKLFLAHGGDLNIPCSMTSTFLTMGFIDGDHDFQDSDLPEATESDDLHGGQKSSKSATGVQVKDAITASDLLPKKPRYEVFSSISALQSKIRTVNRDRCMNCGDYYEGEGPAATLVIALNLTSGLNAGRHHCRHCRRVVCLKCAGNFCTAQEIPDFVRAEYGAAESTYRVCDICFEVLSDRAAAELSVMTTFAEDADNTTSTTVGDGDHSQNENQVENGAPTNGGETTPPSKFSFSVLNNWF